MRTKQFYKGVTAALLLFVGAIAIADELAEGIDAYENGDYVLAREILTPLAEHHGYTKAMNALGLMSEQGLGTSANGIEAEKWYKRAALLADEDAMYNLGILYAEGKVMEIDDVKAIAWLGAAYDHRQDDALEVAKLVSTRMDEKQLAASGVLRREINDLLYSDIQNEPVKLLLEPPVDRARLMTSEQIVEAYSGHSINFMFRDSLATETYRKHRSLKKALAGKKAKLKGEYREGYYKGKWWIENNMICFDYAKIDVFDACFWVEQLSENEIQTYSQKTGEIGRDKIIN